MKVTTMIRTLGTLLAATLLLAACGGGGGGGADRGLSGSPPNVSSMQASAAFYGRTMTVSVSGTGLDGAIEMTSDNACSSITRLAGGTEFSQSFSCRVDWVGEYNLGIRTAAGRPLGSLRVNVSDKPHVTMVTNRGTIVIELELLQARATVENFLNYVNDGFYRNVVFHRVIAGEVAQAGGFRPTTVTNETGLVAVTNVRAPIVLESNVGLKHLRGTIGMAREAATPNSATSQFFFNLKDNPQFDHQDDTNRGLAVFGRIVQGLDVMDTIGNATTRFDLRNGLGKTVTEVSITSATQTR